MVFKLNSSWNRRLSHTLRGEFLRVFHLIAGKSKGHVIKCKWLKLVLLSQQCLVLSTCLNVNETISGRYFIMSRAWFLRR